MYGYCFDDPVNGIDPLGLQVRGRGPDVNVSPGRGFTAGAGLRFVWDDDDNVGLVGSVRYGGTSSREPAFAFTMADERYKKDTIFDLPDTTSNVGKLFSLDAPEMIKKPAEKALKFKLPGLSVGGELLYEDKGGLAPEYLGHSKDVGLVFGGGSPEERTIKNEKSWLLWNGKAAPKTDDVDDWGMNVHIPEKWQE